ncbi:class I SAM-dependent methyltransferase [Streptomyces tubbatahanensis]|uniref:Class I SAM-dependent methyltransferase n=1 Tax=Streptomyces tubbatahanensis TaxID=2923272 RepID=A0ABY3XM78_9ACTN|nr:class I SAM-dependent methyltransferase [Streptomyces tubbatahanensis]UNS95521.1 class I SAM-dependent methyltransferase [Streptomyces tubbatahanensis]
MADELFRQPRLAALYDVLEGERADLEPYLALVAELGARRVLDLGCGTGTFALLLAARGIEVTGVDPAGASLHVARSKAGGQAVRWICGDARAAPPLDADLVTMTANVAQEIVGRQAWRSTLGSAYGALRPGGHLVFETRNPAVRAWERWNREDSYRVTRVPGGGTVASWSDLVAVEGPLVTFRHAYEFSADGRVLTSESTLRFRDREEVEADLGERGFAVRDVRDAPDRPGRELVFVARRTDGETPPRR